MISENHYNAALDKAGRLRVKPSVSAITFFSAQNGTHQQ
jgi:hypothetical protein